MDPAASGTAEAACDGFPTLTEAKLKALAERAGRNIPERVWYYAPKVGGGLWLYYYPLPEVPAGQLLQPGKSQLQLPTDVGSAEVFDSVVAHELCRQKRMNHSTAFYAHMQRDRKFLVAIGSYSLTKSYQRKHKQWDKPGNRDRKATQYEDFYDCLSG